LRAAAIDVGTNSVKVLVGEAQSDSSVARLYEASLNTRLGEGTDSTRMLSPSAQDRTIEAIKRHLESAAAHSPDAIRIVATSAVRDAGNRTEFALRVQREFGHPLEILEPEEEARLAYLSVAMDETLSVFSGAQVVLDVGGGSTEITLGKGDAIARWFSVNVGAVRLTERFLTKDPPTTNQVVSAADAVDQALEQLVLSFQGFDRVVAIGGSIVNIARMIRGLAIERTVEVHATTLPREELSKLVSRLSGTKVEERKHIVGLEPKRADIVLGGALIFERALGMLGQNELVVSCRGLRWGILYDMLSWRQ